MPAYVLKEVLKQGFDKRNDLASCVCRLTSFSRLSTLWE